MLDLTDLYIQQKSINKFQYNSNYRDIPIVIDNGSYQFKCGFAIDSCPYLEFKNVIAKSKSKKEGILVGNEIEDFYANIRYAFDRNVVVNFDVQESVFDYAFDNLGLQTLQDHPIVINEPLCNPNTCRQQMSELLFEAYDVPSIAYYIDGLASYAYNNPEYLESTANDTVLILSFGYQSIHLLPLFNGRLEAKLCRKINVGGSQLDSLMMRLLQLKYSCHSNIIDLRMGEYLQQKTCSLALNYRQEMMQWKSSKYHADNSLIIQMPFKKSEKMLSNEQLEEKKKQQMLRGKEMHLKRNQEKLASAQDNLSNLMNLISSKDNMKKKIINSMGFENEQHVMNEMKNIELLIEKLQCKIRGIDCPTKIENLEPKQKFDLIDISDDELDEDELKQKQKQVMLRAAALRREQIRLMKEMKRNKILSAVNKLEESREDDFALWVMNLRHQRQSLLDNRMKKRSSLSVSMGSAGPSIGIDERRQQKARKIRKIAAELNEDLELKYIKKGSSQNQLEDDRYAEDLSDDDSDTEQKQLCQLEILLNQYDPEFTKDNNSSLKVDIEEYYKLHLSTEQFRVPEIIFKPYMIGYEEAGLGEMLENLINGSYLLHLYDKNSLQTKQLADNIFLTGSVSKIPNLKERLFYEIRQFLPTSLSDPIIKIADDPTLDAWRGACKLALHTQFDSMSISKELYEEMGHDYIQEHPLSNFFYTPLTDVDEMSC